MGHKLTSQDWNSAYNERVAKEFDRAGTLAEKGHELTVQGWGFTGNALHGAGLVCY
jgi:hypothetical protein